MKNLFSPKVPALMVMLFSISISASFGAFVAPNTSDVYYNPELRTFLETTLPNLVGDDNGDGSIDIKDYDSAYPSTGMSAEQLLDLLKGSVGGTFDDNTEAIQIVADELQARSLADTDPSNDLTGPEALALATEDFSPNKTLQLIYLDALQNDLNNTFLNSVNVLFINIENNFPAYFENEGLATLTTDGFIQDWGSQATTGSPAENIPIDGGLSFLALGGIAFGISRIRRNK